MKINERAIIIHGASDWMKKRGFWLDEMPDSIDGLTGTVVADFTCLSGDDSHYIIALDETETEIGVSPLWVIPYNTGYRE